MYDLVPMRLLTHRRSAWVTATGALLVMLSACQDTASPDGSALRLPSATSSRVSQATNNGRISNEYIVVFNDDVTDVKGRANAILKAHGGTLNFTYSDALKGFSAHLSDKQAAALADDPDIAFIEQDQLVNAAGSGTQSPVNGNLDRIDQRGPVVDNSYSWSSDGTGVTVYILDTGIRITHNDFGGRASYGVDIVGGTGGADCNGHGTHVSGTVGGSFFGVAKNVSLVSVRVLDCSGAATVSNVIAGLDWVTRNHVSPSVANLSLTTMASSTLNQAIANTIAAGVTVVGAAGEYYSGNACDLSPGSAPGAIIVGASHTTINITDEIAGFSDYGSCVTLFAPGQSVTSAWYTGDNINWTLDGTSMAAAAASGAAAMYLSTHPGATPSDVKNALIANATTGVLMNVQAGTPNRLLYVGNDGGTGGGTGGSPPPPNAAPTASFKVSCAKTVCSFDASGSRDDVGIVSYAWNYGDGVSETKSVPTTSHTYKAKGKTTVTITLTVTDGGGLTGTARQSITVSAK